MALYICRAEEEFVDPHSSRPVGEGDEYRKLAEAGAKNSRLHLNREQSSAYVHRGL